MPVYLHLLLLSFCTYIHTAKAAGRPVVGTSPTKVCCWASFDIKLGQRYMPLLYPNCCMTVEISQTVMELSTHSPLSVFCMFCFTKRQVQHSWNITGNVLSMTKSKRRGYNFNPPLSTLSCVALQSSVVKLRERGYRTDTAVKPDPFFALGSQAQLSPYDSQLNTEERQMGRRLSHCSLHKTVHRR